MSKALVALSIAWAVLVAGGGAGASAVRQSPGCRSPAPAALHEPNIFTETQENDLGDAIAEHIGREFRVIDDDGVTAYLRYVGQRLVQHLPSTKLHFQFFLVDLPDANAFVLPGGRIYVSRKLIAFTQTEDELAAILGHETGHLAARQLPVKFSRLFKDVLGVTAVGDRADIFDKYNQWMDNVARKPSALRTGDDDGDQIEADAIGLYAMAAAGYDPQVEAEFFDRLADTKGNTGNFLSNLFGATSPDSIRLKEMLRTLQTLPAGCVDLRPRGQNEAYQNWKASVVSFTGLTRKESLHGVDERIVLDQPLGIDVSDLRFSPDGRFIVAQDDGGVTVLTREPFALLFRIDAPGSVGAHFTPDSRSVVFHTRDLRVERWDVSSQALVQANELFIRRSCLQTALAPDGRVLACVDGGETLNRYTVTLVDVGSGRALFTAPEFTAPDRPTALVLNVRGLASLVDSGWRFLEMSFSPDGRYFAAAHHRDGFPGVSSGEDALVYDIVRRVELPVRGDVRRLMAGGFAFTGPDRFLAANQDDLKKSIVVGLPGGDIVGPAALPKGELSPATRGAFLFVRPFQSFAVGVLDLARQRVVKGLPNDAIDIYGDVVVAERGTGELGLYTMDNTLTAAVTLPRSSLSGMLAGAISDDFRWLAVSEASRGSVWDLSSGQGVTQTRPFDGAAFSLDDLLFADFSKEGDGGQRMMRVDPTQIVPTSGFDIKEDRASQVGPYLFVRRPLRKGASLTEGLEIDVRDLLRPATLWTKTFLVEPPEIWTSVRGAQAVALGWSMTSRTARAELKDDEAMARLPAVQRPTDADYLIEILDMRTGRVRGKIVFETGAGSFGIADIVVDGDVVAIADSENRVHIYSLASGQSNGRVFGSRALVSEAAGVFVVENGPGKLSLYDVATLHRRDEFAFSHNVAMAAFSPDGGRLLVLTADQTVYVLEVPRAATGTTQSGSGFQPPGGGRKPAGSNSAKF